MATSTTGNPNAGLVYLTLAGKDESGNAITVQASGVLISDDEVLTAAHVVYNDDGSLRASGTAIVGSNAGGVATVSRVDGVQALGKGDYASIAGIGGDYAVVHLASKVTSGTVFGLGSDLASGTFTVSGYPQGTAGQIDTRTETLVAAAGTQVYLGQTLNDGSGQPEGSSGGSVYQVVGGSPVAYGIVSAESAGDTSQGFFKQLTGADVAQIRAWVSAADAGGVATVAAAAAPSHAAPGFTPDIADMLTADAAAASGTKAAVMSDVAAAITQACADGGTFAAMSADATQILGGASYARRAVAYLAGLLGGTTGAWDGNLQNTANTLVDGAVTGGGTRAAAAAGYAEGQGMGTPVATAAIIAPNSAQLAGVIADSGQGTATPVLTAVGTDPLPALMASHRLDA